MIEPRELADQWDDAEAPDDPVEQLLLRSRLLGSSLRITNFGGGNTSTKVEARDSVSGEPIDVLWVKGSGGDLGSLQRANLAALDLGRVLQLERGYEGVEHEDDQADLLFDCVVRPRGVAPSIDTPLHALLPYRDIDHVHPDAVIALATAVDGRALTRAAYGDDVGWVPWQRPGFDLGLKVRDVVRERPDLQGIVLGGHGLIAWGDDSASCYRTTALADRARRGVPARGGRAAPHRALRRRGRRRAAARGARTPGGAPVPAAARPHVGPRPARRPLPR